MCFTSMHRPEHLSQPADTRISVPDADVANEGLTAHELAEVRVRPTEEQMKQLDAEIDAIFEEATAGAYASLAIFKVMHPEPGASDLKSLMESMPSPMRPRIIRVAKLVALHPEEGERIQARISEMIGFSLVKEGGDPGCEPEDEIRRAANRTRRLAQLRVCAHTFLAECGEQDEEFSDELTKIVLAEQLIGNNSQQIAQIGK